MAVSEIPLSPENQRFSISLAGKSSDGCYLACCVLVSGYHGQQRCDLIKGSRLSPALTCWRSIAISGLAFRFMWAAITRPMKTPPKPISE
jgi:hypothetical protein